MIPVIDIFAGPGGLGEGFSSVISKAGVKQFEVRLSIEKHQKAHKTLRLRSFFREFNVNEVPNDYYDFLRGQITLEELFNKYPREAEIANTKSWLAELGSESFPQRLVRKRIKYALNKSSNWVLIGGPPCQAYSVAGRSRNSGNGSYDPKSDVRQKLYVEYLQIIADHWPAVFIMENVKGLLSASLEHQKIFHRMIEDLQQPASAIRREGRTACHTGRKHRYEIYSLIKPNTLVNDDVRDSVVKAENYGIPQSRHRVILLGIRDDIGHVIPKTLNVTTPIPAWSVLSDFPSVRSGLSGKNDSPKEWLNYLRSSMNKRWFTGVSRAAGKNVQDYLKKILDDLIPPSHDRGAEFMPAKVSPSHATDWFVDRRLDGICSHQTRQHMANDLHRYLFAACFAKVHSRTPMLRDFPPDLLPRHDSVEIALEEGGNFSDRFRVQVEDRPATTITSHISKDGHYYIHPDPTQCRSLTVREAARLQTFPDNYFFVGPRTSQYVQVGNAVPPLLARQIAEIVYDIFDKAGMVV